MEYRHSMIFRFISVCLVLLHICVFCFKDAGVVFAEETAKGEVVNSKANVDSQAISEAEKANDSVALKQQADSSEETDSAKIEDESESGRGDRQTLDSTSQEGQNSSFGFNLNALQNIQPSLFTGALTYSVPISVPAGRKGIQPNIVLAYSSQSGNGMLGMGWILELGSVERSTKNGVPNYNNQDTFIFKTGGSVVELVNIGGNEYRAKIEEAFMKFTFDGYSWTVKDKSGITYYFGQTQDSQQLDSGHVFKWCLDKVEDLSGNYMILTYIKDANQIYPDTVNYTGCDGQENLASAFQVDFDYESGERVDYFFSYRSNFLIRTNKLLRTITVKQNGSRIRKYNLSYEYSSSTKRALLSSVTQYGLDDSSSLPPVEFNYQEKPFTFSQVTSWNNIHNFGNNDWAGTRSTGGSGSAYVDIFDINRDGLPDRIFRGYNDSEYNRLWVQLNNGTSFDNLQAWSNIAAQSGQTNRASVRYGSSHGDTNTFDINGDGLPDRIYTYYNNNYNTWEVQINNGNGFENSIAWNNIDGFNYQPDYTKLWGFAYDPPVWGYIDLFDINGDGKPDRVIRGTNSDRWYVQLNNGNNGFDNSIEWLNVQYHSHSSEGYIRTGGSNTYFATFDINGDGLPDHLMDNTTSDYTWQVQFNNGKSFENRQEWGILGNKYGSWSYMGYGDPACVTTIDINGDGLPDRVTRNYNDTYGNWQVQINNGHGFEPIAEWGPIVHNNNSNRAHIRSGYNPTIVDFFDINGDGLPDRVMRPLNTPYDHWDVQLNNGPIPDLLAGISNGVGGAAAVTYHTYVGHDNTEQADKGKLGFPVSVVAEVEVSDGRSNTYSTQYSYDKGEFDYANREFSGFGKVTVTDAEGNYSVSYFHQDEYKKGRQYKQEARNSSGNLYTKSENTWNVQGDIYAGYPQVKFIYLSESNAYTFDGDDSARRIKTQYLYDESPQHGNPTQVIEYGEVDADSGSDISQDRKTASMEYNYNTTDWILSLPKHIQVADINGNNISEKRFYYDNNQNIDDEPTQGLLTKEEVRCYNPITQNETWLSTQYAYDSFGNLTSATDANSHTSATTYDSVYHIYPLTITNALGHTVTTQYYGINGVPLNDGQGLKGLFGQVKSTRDPNAVTAYTSYDDLGRQEKVIGPNDSISYPSTIYEYDLNVTNPVTDPVKITQKVKAVNSPSSTNYPSYYTSYSFYDGMGRLIESKSPAEPNPQGGALRQIVSGLVEYNNRGLTAKKYFPYYVDSSPDFISPDYNRPYFSFQYDCLGRVIQTTNPDNTYSSVNYDDWTVTATDESNHTKTHYYDALQRLIRVDEHNNGETYTTTYAYDISGNLTSVTDSQNNTTTIAYDSLGRKIRMNDPDMGVWNYEYDNIGNLTRQVDAAGQELTFTYDVLNRLTQKTIQNDQTVTYTYDGSAENYYVGRLRQVNYEAGQAQFFYDNLGREIRSVKTVDGQDYTVQRTYDPLDRLITLTYPDNEIVTYTYNPQGIETVRSIQEVDSYTKLLLHNDGQDGSTNFTDSSLSNYNITANGSAQIDTAQSKFGGGSVLLGGNGDYLSTSDSDDWHFGTGDFTIDFWVRFNDYQPFQTFVSQYVDANNYWYIMKEARVGGNKLWIKFRSGGVNKGWYYMTTAWSGIANDTWYHLAFVRNGASALIFINGVSQALSEHDTFGANDVGDTDSSLYIGQDGNSTNYVNGWVDELRISKGIARWTSDFTPPENSYASGSQDYVTNINYSPAGQITKIQYGNGTTTEYAYNPQTMRLTDLVTQNSSGSQIQNLEYTFDNSGNVTAITDNVNNASQQFQYDDLSRLTNANGTYYGNVNYSYDSIGNILSKGNLALNYNGTRPHAVSSCTNSQTGQAVNFTYDTNGNMSNRINQQTNEQTNYYYDFESHLTRAEQIYPQGQAATVTLNFQPGWNFFSLPVVPQDSQISQIFSGLQIGTDYDQISRYSPETDSFQNYVGNPDFDEFNTLEYNKGYAIYVNNPQGFSIAISGVTPEPQGISLAQGWNLIPYPYLSNRSTQQALGNLELNVDYDLVLSYNQTTGQFEQYPGSLENLEPNKSYYIHCLQNTSWNIEPLSRATNFYYDGDGGRVKKVSQIDQAETTIYIGSLFEKVVPDEGEETTKKHIYAGANRVCVVENSSRKFFHGDHLGSSNVITDENGSQISHYEYSPFGEVSFQDGSYSTDIKYTGKIQDDTGLYYYGARYYDPVIGRFISPDPTIQHPNDPQDLNRYAYCRNNPINLIDPTGFGFKKWFKEFFSENAGVVGLLFGFVGLIAASIYTGNWQPTRNMAIATATGFILGGSTGAVAAFVSTNILETQPGQQVVNWAANEIFDDAFGMRPRAAYFWSYLITDALLTAGVSHGIESASNPNKVEIRKPNSEEKSYLRDIQNKIKAGEIDSRTITRTNGSNLFEMPESSWRALTVNGEVKAYIARAPIFNIPFMPLQHTTAYLPDVGNMSFGLKSYLWNVGVCHQSVIRALEKGGIHGVTPLNISWNNSVWLSYGVYGREGQMGATIDNLSKAAYYTNQNLRDGN
ncbi:MAG: SpvB/TcaC N-terminal domain-containing protein [Candidatus Omnitrophica bacterium]|nr:SpvB/TcaC N-terminal domain-containing protein [Candidatus Omnitrophota bacterium]MDD5352254.1 SpvB/TcaC N-terminal domain-containing protein [Candidatus Omnitrophota bacterium]MDD5549852.1 SpvB/TcaC N-terminal domain-containing protein [Candidatus Omnitrophota bacterium]